MKNPEFTIDADYIIKLRREIHQYPELGFDLPRTIELVKRELNSLGIGYTEQFGQSSVVATINPGKDNYTIGIRADMDALALEELKESPYRSKIPGQMHACGHDAHTAMLLGAAKALVSLGDQIKCRIKLIFQPSEEGRESGAKRMVQDNVMDDIDIIIGLHIETALDAGLVGVCPGFAMPASRTVKLDFKGKSTHATTPHKGVDALAMAVRVYNAIQLMLTRETDPLSRYVCSFNQMGAGTTQNIVADAAFLLGTIRSYEAEVDRLLINRITQIAEGTAREMGGSCQVQSNLKCLPVYNDKLLSASWEQSALRQVGPERVVPFYIKMGSEDFSFYLSQKPGVFFRLGIRNEELGITATAHNGYFDLDESALATGSAVFVRFVLDHMDGKAVTEGVVASGYDWE